MPSSVWIEHRPGAVTYDVLTGTGFGCCSAVFSGTKENAEIIKAAFVQVGYTPVKDSEEARQQA